MIPYVNSSAWCRDKRALLLALPLTCVALVKSGSFPETQFPPLCNGMRMFALHTSPVCPGEKMQSHKWMLFV